MGLGKKLAKFRREAGYTQQQLGEILNVSAQAVSKWENEQSEPDLRTLRQLSNLYHLSVDDLLKEEEAETLNEEQAPSAAEKMPAAPAESAAERSSAPVQPAAPRPAASAETAAGRPSVPAQPQFLGYCGICGVPVYKGNEVRSSLGIFCKSCYRRHSPAAQRKAACKNNDYPSFLWGLLSFLIPVIGIILYISWHEVFPYRAGSCLRGFIAGLIVWAIVAGGLSLLFSLFLALPA